MARLPWLLCAAQALVIVALVLLVTWPREGAPLVMPAVDPAADGAAAPAVSPGTVLTAAVGSHADSNDSHASVRQPAIADGSPASTSDDLIGHVLFGRVVDGEGKPIDGTTVTAARPGTDDSWWGSARKGRGYCISGLEAGEWNVTAHNQGFAPFERKITLTGAPAMTRLDIELQRSIRVLVKVLTPEGQPFSKVLAQAQDADAHGKGALGFGSNELTGVATVEPPVTPAERNGMNSPWPWIANWEPGRGQWGGKVLAPEYLGTLNLHRPPPLFVSLVLSQIVLVTQRLEADATEIAFTLSVDDVRKLAATVRARFVDRESGQPIARLRVTVGPEWMGDRSVETDAEGAVTFANQPPSTVNLRVLGKDREPFARRLRLEPGRTTDVGTIRLGGPVAIRGTLIDAAGQPASGRVNALDLDRADASDPMAMMYGGTSTTALGDFEVKPLGRGRHLLRFFDERQGLLGWTLVGTDNGSVSGIRLQAQATGTLTIAGTAPKGTEYLVILRSGDDLPLQSRNVGGGNGTRHEVRVPLGSYKVEVWQGRRLVRCAPVAVTAAGTRFDLP